MKSEFANCVVRPAVGVRTIPGIVAAPRMEANGRTLFAVACDA